MRYLTSKDGKFHEMFPTEILFDHWQFHEITLSHSIFKGSKQIYDTMMSNFQ